MGSPSPAEGATRLRVAVAPSGALLVDTGGADDRVMPSWAISFLTVRHLSLPPRGGKEWWAGTGLNRRHQDFQYSASFARIARLLNDLPSRAFVADVALSCAQLHAGARRE